MTTETRDPLTPIGNAVDSAVNVFVTKRSQTKQRLAELGQEMEPENVARRQAASLIGLTDSGVQEMVVDIARKIRDDHPDVTVGITSASGDVDDYIMAVLMDFERRDTPRAHSFRRIMAFAVVPEDRNGAPLIFGLSEGGSASSMGSRRMGLFPLDSQTDPYAHIDLTLMAAGIEDAINYGGPQQVVSRRRSLLGEPQTEEHLIQIPLDVLQIPTS